VLSFKCGGTAYPIRQAVDEAGGESDFGEGVRGRDIVLALNLCPRRVTKARCD
jgi:hypothetical protein